jgi:zinc protease
VKVFVESSAALPLVSFTVAFRAGAVLDPPGKEGLSRVTTRMLRRGAEGLDHDAIEQQVDLLGGEIGADAAMSTCTLQGEVLARNLEPFARLCSTLIGKSSFPADEVGRLVREMQAEIVESRDSDRSLASRALRRTLFDGHPYGRRVSGSIASLETITQPDVIEYFRRRLTRAGAVVAFSGDIDQARAEAVAELLLEGVPAGAPPADEVADPPVKPGRRLVLVDRPDRTQVQLGIGAIGTTPRDPDFIPWFVGNTAFGGTFTSRLMQEIRAKRGWSYGASSRIGYDRRRDAFSMWAAPSAQDAAACLGLELELLGAVKHQGLSADEVEFVKNYLVRSHAFEIDTPRKRVSHPLEEVLFDLPAGFHASWVTEVRAVTAESVNAALARKMPDEDLVVAAVATRSEVGEAIAAAIPGLVDVTVLPPDFE